MTDPTTATLDVVLRADHGGPSARLERRLSAAIEDVWSVVTDPERITRWLAPIRLDGEPSAGVGYTVAFGDDAGGDQADRAAHRVPGAADQFIC